MANRAEQFKYILANMKENDPNRWIMINQIKKEEKKLKASKLAKRKASDKDVNWKEFTVEALTNKANKMNKETLDVTPTVTETEIEFTSTHTPTMYPTPTPTDTPVGTVGLTVPVTETPKPTSTPEVTPTDTPVGTVGLTVTPPDETPKPTATPDVTYEFNTPLPEESPEPPKPTPEINPTMEAKRAKRGKKE